MAGKEPDNAASMNITHKAGADMEPSESARINVPRDSEVHKDARQNALIKCAQR